MAIVSQGWELVITLIDSANMQTSRTYELQSATAAEAAADAAAVLAALVTVTLGEVVGYRVAEVFAEDAITTPGAGIFRNNNALVTVRLDGAGEKKATYSIPMPSSGVFVGTQGQNANVVDIADAGVLAYTGLFAAASEAFLSDGETVDEALYGRRVFRDTPTT